MSKRTLQLISSTLNNKVVLKNVQKVKLEYSKLGAGQTGTR